MLQIVYVSTARNATSEDVAAILVASRRNNVRDDITGLLYSDGGRFLQVLEGPNDAVEATLKRIAADPRHRAVVELSRREVPGREFGDWAMAHRAKGADLDAFVKRVDVMVANADPTVRATFESFARVRRAA